MCAVYWKIMIAVGLAMTLAGLILMIKSMQYTYRDGDGKKQTAVSPGPVNPTYNKIGWLLTILGYLLQITGVFLV